MLNAHNALFVVLGICCIFAGCSPQSATSERGSNPVTPAKIQAQDYGEVRVLPASGSGAEGVFRVTFSQTRNTQKPALVGLLINKSLTGENACYSFWNLSSGEATLVADAGAGVLPLKGSSVGNGQCQILRDGTTSTDEASGVTVNFHLRFLPSFRGAKHLWAIAEGAQSKGELKPVGDWIVE